MAATDASIPNDPGAPPGAWRPVRGEAKSDAALSNTIGRLVQRLAIEFPLVMLVNVIALLWTVQMAAHIQADSWLNLVAGREIVRNGLPHHDTLAIISHGRTWIDQQWLAHLFLYGLYRVDGLALVSVVNILVVAGSIGLARCSSS